MTTANSVPRVYGTRTDSPGCAGAAGRAQGTLLSVGQRTEYLDRDFLRGLNELVKATASMPTMRTIILISDGFNRFPGRELYGIMDGFGPSTNRMIQFNPHDQEAPLQVVLKLAVQYNVKFYTIDSRGLYAAASLGSNSFDASNGAVIPERVDQGQMTVPARTPMLSFNWHMILAERSLKTTMTSSREFSAPSLIPVNITCWLTGQPTQPRTALSER